MRFFNLFIFIFIFLIGVYGYIDTYGNGIDTNSAKQIGYNFLLQKIGAKRLIAPENMQLEYLARGTSGEACLYVFNVQDGFVIVAANDVVQPILAYSNENQFHLNKISASALHLINGYTKQIDEVIAKGVSAKQEIALQWNILRYGYRQTNAERTTGVVVAPLLGSITWDQAPYYNDSCPNDATGGGRSVTGCVATATAQVMKFWSWPASGVGSHSYTTYTRHFSCSASFAHSYNWSGMPPAIVGHNSLIAQLMWDVGVAVDMDYTAAESGAYVISSATGTAPYCAQYALTQFFRYDPVSIKGLARAAYSNSSWLTLIKNDLSAGLPVIYSGYGTSGGHCWVLDGYDDTLGTNYFHCNWGWSGFGPNGYYSVDDMNPPALGTGGGSGGFVSGQAAIFGVKPFLPAINGTLTVCAGHTTTLNNATPGGNWVSDSTSKATISSTGVVTGVAAGTTTITYKIGNVKVTAVVTVGVPPVAANIAGANHVCINRVHDTLTASITGGSWNVTNSNAQVTAGVVSGLVTGIDTVIYTLTNFCGSASDSFKITIPTAKHCDSLSEVHEIQDDNSIRVYPNPSSGKFLIQLPEGLVNARCFVFNMYGKAIQESLIPDSDNEVNIDLAGLCNGVYMIRIDAPGKSFNALFTKIAR